MAQDLGKSADSVKSAGAPENAENNPSPKIEVTDAMVEAGVNAIGPFDLNHALEGGYSEKAELVIQIYKQMAAFQRSL
jgi:hypothetical protein